MKGLLGARVTFIVGAALLAVVGGGSALLRYRLSLSWGGTAGRRANNGIAALNNYYGGVET